MIYQTLNHQINEHTFTVVSSDGKNLNIRPKTCQLLLLLVKNHGKATNKQVILEMVWGGSVVGEQVIFQSVNEIRQLFPNSEVIKTIPKHGYIWVPNVEIKDNSKSFKKILRKSLFAFCFLMIVLVGSLVFEQYEITDGIQLSQKNITGSIVILPIQNQIEGNDHSWIRLGMMDQIIQRTPSTPDYGVLQTDYVLEVLKRTNTSLSTISAELIQQIFKVSGAELIITSKLVGEPYDYQLSYVFYYRNRLQKGVLFNRNIQSLVDEFSRLISAELGNEFIPTEITYQKDFNNELLGKAIEKNHEGHYQQAEPLLESIVLSNVENITAQRILIETLQRLKKFEQVFERLDVVLPIAQKQQDKDELTRLLYLKALNYYVTYNDEKAEKIAMQALVVAKENNDWLYMAHIKNIQGNVAINKNDYKLAEKLFFEQKQHHNVLGCPVGEAISWSNLARLAQIQNQPDKFSATINKAITIASTRNLTSQLSYFTKIKEQYYSQLKQ